MRYILASGSPRRRELIRQAGIDAEIIPAAGSEKSDRREPASYVADLASHKAEEIGEKQMNAVDDCCIIGADTVVVLDNSILGKPKDREDARRMIRSLQGRTHEVMTGVCLLYQINGIRKKTTFTEISTVHVCPMTEEEIESYVATGEADDKAGAYGIQGRFGIYIDRIEGDYYNIVGLPISRLVHTMQRAGLR